MKKNTYLLLVIACAFLAIAFTLYETRQYDSDLSNVALVYENTATHPLPLALSIPKINVEAKVESVGVTEAGNMATPRDSNDVGWYQFGAIPGDNGNAVLAGHLDDASGAPSVFSKLSRLSKGDDLYVTNAKNERLHFVVVGSKVYDYDANDTSDVFGATTTPHLNLITCNGSWDKNAKTYNKRLVVFTELKP